MAALDSLVPEDHKVRIIWEMAQEYDLSKLYGYIDAIEGEAGRPAIDPLILVVLWLYATTEGVGSARELARLCEEHIAYQWILGGVSVNYHTLADFRVNYESELDEILTENVAALMSEGIVSLDRTAQDGIRVRASAGGGSFRRQARLETFLIEAEKEVKALKEVGGNDGEGVNLRRLSAQKRASEERLVRVKKALEEIKKAKETKARSHKSKDKQKEARSSTTDAEARIMKMADGGFRPAYNGQFSVDVESGIVVGVDVTNQVDQGQMIPMIDQIDQRYQRVPKEHLVDGGFVTTSDMEEAFKRNVQIYAPLPEEDPEKSNLRKPYKLETPVVQAWRKRMNSLQGKEIYKERASSIEWVNALARNRGLQQFEVRGKQKVKSALLWFVLVHNLWVSHRLCTVSVQGCI
jgi:transposase/Skp family chaperone for outer membrane proteins